MSELQRLNDAQRLIVEENLGIAHSKANYWKRKLTWWELDDCVGLAYLGLCKAVLIWDETKGKLTTVSYRVIDNLYLAEIKRVSHKKRSNGLPVVSLDETYGLGEQSLLDTLAVEDKRDSDNSIVNVIPFLSKSETFLFHEKFTSGKSQYQIAREQGIARSTVSKRERKLVAKIRVLLEGD